MILANALRQYPHELSGGMKQRICIARALLCKPALVLADEPTTALDVTIQAQILELLREMRRRHDMSMVLVTHDMGVVAQMADRVAVMYAGRMCETGSARTIFASPLHPYTRALLESTPRIDRSYRRVRGQRLTAISGRPPDMTHPPAGCRFHDRCPDRDRGLRARDADRNYYSTRPYRQLYPPGKPRGAGGGAGGMTMPLLQVENLTKRYVLGRKGLFGTRKPVENWAVDDVSFSIDAGATLGLVGESGCGKTTTARSILRLVAPTSGTVRLGGREITHTLAGKERAPMLAVRRQVQYVFQDPLLSLNPRWSIGMTLREPLRVHGIGTPKEWPGRIAQLLDLVGLNPHYQYRYPHELSGGQRQRVGIARALAVEPRVLICDEPVSSLDVSVRAQILNLLAELQERLGLRISLHFARPQLGPLSEHPCRRDVSRQASLRLRPPTRCLPIRTTTTRAPCSAPFRFRTQTQRSTTHLFQARYQAQSGVHRAARSIPDVRRRCRVAARRSRS